MYRIFVNSQIILGQHLTIDQPESVHHLKNVLRAKRGEECVICDEKGNEYYCIIDRISLSSLDFAVKSSVMHSQEFFRPELAVACALPKKTAFDDIVDQLTQIGVTTIIPMTTERVVVRLDSKKEKARLQRWRKIALNASEQSQRNTLPHIEEIKNFKEAITLSSEYELKLIPALIDQRRPLKEILSVHSRTRSIFVLIGPEGDFSPKEVESAKNAGFIPVTLGPRVLRVETAAVAAASFIQLSLQS